MEISTFKGDFGHKVSVQFRSYIYNFYYVFCSFGYYAFLIHFKFVPVEHGYEIYTNNVRKVLCFVIHLFIVMLGLGGLRKKFAVPKIVDKPNQFFIMVEGICLFSYILVFIHMVLTKQNVLLNIMNSSTHCNDNKRNVKYRKIAIFLHILAIFSCGVHLYADTFYGHATFIDLIRTNAGKFYYGFHWRDTDHPLTDSEITASSIFFTLFFLIVKIFLRISSHFTELSFYIGAIAIGLTIKDFLHLLSHNQHLPIQKIVPCYEDMKLLIEHINAICGGFIVIVFVASIPHFARDSIAVFDSAEWWLILDYMQYAMLYLASLAYAAEATNNMNQFTKYLSDCAKNDKSMTEPDKLETIFLEIQAVRYPVGLEGYGFFTVTYKFLGSFICSSTDASKIQILKRTIGVNTFAICTLSVFSIFVTYTLILLQLQ